MFLAWERFLAAQGENSSNLCHVLADVLERKTVKSKMSLSQHYRTIYLKFPYQSLLSSSQLQLLYTLLFLAGCLFVDLLATFVELR